MIAYFQKRAAVDDGEAGTKPSTEAGKRAPRQPIRLNSEPIKLTVPGAPGAETSDSSPPRPAAAKPADKPKPEPKPEPKPKPEPETKPEPAPETKPAPGPEPETKPGPEPETKPGPEPEPDPGTTSEESVQILAAKIQLQVSRSQNHLMRCYQRAAKTGRPDDPLTGRIDVQFSVQPDGSVTGARAVADTTGSQILASCLVGLVDTWSFPSGGQEPLDFVWPFEFKAPK
jgi:outer membrane biosynthesis protein TonB